MLHRVSQTVQQPFWRITDVADQPRFNRSKPRPSSQQVRRSLRCEHEGPWSVVIFMPAAFTFNCPTEDRGRGRALRRVPEGRRRGSHRHHRHALLAQGLARDLPAVGKAQVPAGRRPDPPADQRLRRTHRRRPGLRGTFVINPEGVIKTMEVHDNAIARDVTETLRKLKAAQYTAAEPGRRSARPSGRKAKTTLARRSTWSARSGRTAAPFRVPPRSGPASRRVRAGCPYLDACAPVANPEG